MARVKVAEFGIIQKSLAGASVAIYEADSNGESTGTLATLYQATTGSSSRSNPQTLDDDGKLADDCYVDTTVMAAISNISETTERSIRKIRANPLQYPLPVTSAQSLSSQLTAAAVAAALPLGWQGAWVTTTAYLEFNIVGNGGTSYICILDHTASASNEPGVGGSWTTYWEVFAAKGSAGAGSGDMLAANNLSDLANAATARANLGVAINVNVQAYDGDLAAIAALTSAADRGIMFTGSGTAAVYTLTAAGLALLDDANAAAQRTTLGLGTAAVAGFLDEDTMASNSATDVPSQQSVKAYVDAQTASSVTAASQANQETATSTAVFVSPGTQQYHPSAEKFSVKCDSGGNASQSYNVASIGDTGTGLVTVNIATDFSSADWICHVDVERVTTGLNVADLRFARPRNGGQAAGSVLCECHDGTAVTANLADPTKWHISGRGDQA